MTDIVFIHGWGEDPQIWDKLAPLLPGHKHHFVNLGFVGSEKASPLNLKEPALYITHSLGTMWALKKTDPENILGLVSINGFACFESFTTSRTLQAMSKGLERSAIKQMYSFWKNCNLPENVQKLYEPKLNGDALSQGLSWLSNWDMRKKMHDLEVLSTPILSLGGNKDVILPIEKMHKHWSSLGNDAIIKQGADHTLPLNHPEWCANKTIEFIKENSL